MRKYYRPADEVTRIVVLIGRPGKSTAVGKEIVGVEGGIAEVIVGAAVEIPRAALSYRVDGAAHAARVFGGVVRLKDVDLRHRIDRRFNEGSGAAPQREERDTVERHIQGALPVAVHVEPNQSAVTGGLACGAGGVEDAGQQ